MKRIARTYRALNQHPTSLVGIWLLGAFIGAAVAFDLRSLPSGLNVFVGVLVALTLGFVWMGWRRNKRR